MCAYSVTLTTQTKTLATLDRKETAIRSIRWSLSRSTSSRIARRSSQDTKTPPIQNRAARSSAPVQVPVEIPANQACSVCHVMGYLRAQY